MDTMAKKCQPKLLEYCSNINGYEVMYKETIITEENIKAIFKMKNVT